MVERAALEMRCTHYVVPGVRIPHSPLIIQKGKPQAGFPFFLFTNGQSVSVSAELGDASLKSGIYKKEGAPI